eukprot:2318892-Prymnesium_polylepis.1
MFVFVWAVHTTLGSGVVVGGALSLHSASLAHETRKIKLFVIYHRKCAEIAFRPPLPHGAAV